MNKDISRIGGETIKIPFLVKLSLILVSAMLVIGIFEIVIRTFPEFVPLAALEDFPKDLREEIAVRRNLPTDANSKYYPRDDGLPDFRISAPNTTIVMLHQPEDLKAGALTTIKTDHNGFCNSPNFSWSPAEVDIVTVGDSIIGCTGVGPEKIWSAILKDSKGHPAYALSGGGGNPNLSLQYLKVFGIPLQPKSIGRVSFGIF